MARGVELAAMLAKVAVESLGLDVKAMWTPQPTGAKQPLLFLTRFLLRARLGQQLHLRRLQDLPLDLGLLRGKARLTMNLL